MHTENGVWHTFMVILDIITILTLPARKLKQEICGLFTDELVFSILKGISHVLRWK